MKIHIDTDIGGDPDDLCALAMVLEWPDAELVGVTTVAEHSGKRAGYVHHALRLAGRDDVAVAAGADVELGCFTPFPALPPEECYWQTSVAAAPGHVDVALELLAQSIHAGATIAAIGPYTNLALLEHRSPGILQRADIVLMGGYISAPPPGAPFYSSAEDYNVQADAAAALHVISNCDPLYVPVAVTTQTALRRADMAVLRAGDALAQLIAHQAEMFAQDERYERKYGIINIHHDPLACALALGWREGVTISRVPVVSTLRDGVMTQAIHADGRMSRFVTAVNGARFNRMWLQTVAPARADG